MKVVFSTGGLKRGNIDIHIVWVELYTVCIFAYF